MRSESRYQGTRLGSLLVKRGYINTQQLDAALAEQRTSPDRSLGRILVEQERISEAQLRSLLRHQTRVRWMFAVVAVFTAPFQWAVASPTPTASANAEQVAQQEAVEFANSPQLRLHDAGYKGEKFSTSSSLLGQRILKRAYNSFRDDIGGQFSANAGADGSDLSLSNTNKGSYSMSLSETRVMLKMKFKFSD